MDSSGFTLSVETETQEGKIKRFTEKPWKDDSIFPCLEYLSDVYRFLFAGGINVDIADTPFNEYQKWLNKLIKKNKLGSKLRTYWYETSKTGETLLVPSKKNNYYLIKFFSKKEIKPIFDKNDDLIELRIERKIANKGIYRLRITNEAYFSYEAYAKTPTIDEKTWLGGEMLPHMYGVIPAILVQNNLCTKTNRGTSDFTDPVLKMAEAIAKTDHNYDETNRFFGNPLIDSPSKSRTTKALQNKEQVLQKEPNDEGGGHDLLQPVPFTREQLDYLKSQKDSFRRSIGVLSPIDEVSGEHSGVAIHNLTDGLVSVATEKWEILVNEGLEPLFDMILRMASLDGFLNLSGDLVIKDCMVEISRKKPYYTPTPQDIKTNCDIALSLLELGVSRENALKIIYPHKSSDEIKDLINPILEE